MEYAQPNHYVQGYWRETLAQFQSSVKKTGTAHADSFAAFGNVLPRVAWLRHATQAVHSLVDP